MITVHALKYGEFTEDRPVTGGVYLHGQLQSDNGFDLCSVDNLPTVDGLYRCEVVMSDGSVRKAKLYFWTVDRGTAEISQIINRGLIVDAFNVEDNKCAGVKLMTRSPEL